MSNLNEQQFAQYTAIKKPHPTLEYEIHPAPASMERHAPGEYQPTLPGMERMVPGEMTHTDVFFKHPNAVDPDTWEVPGSKWFERVQGGPPKYGVIDHKDLHPTQDWVEESNIHSRPDERHTRLPSTFGARPLVEKINGMNVVSDGHHRIVRDMLEGKTRSGVARWG